MAQQLIINVSRPSIMQSLRNILGAIDGVSIEPTARSRKTPWEENPEVMASIRRGESDLAHGRCKEMTASDIREFLGV